MCFCLPVGHHASLVPSPTPSFLSLYRTASDEKLGVGLGTRLPPYIARVIALAVVAVRKGTYMNILITRHLALMLVACCITSTKYSSSMAFAFHLS